MSSVCDSLMSRTIISRKKGGCCCWWMCSDCFRRGCNFHNIVSHLAAVNAMERTEIKINIISEQLGLSWAGQCREAALHPLRLHLTTPHHPHPSVPQSWPASCSSVSTTSTGSAWRTPIRCWTRVLLCSACGSAGKANGPRVSTDTSVSEVSVQKSG